MYMYLSTNDNSLIDYVSVSEELFPFINNFTVHDMHSFSPHLPTSIAFKLNYFTSHQKVDSIKVEKIAGHMNLFTICNQKLLNYIR